MMNNPEPLPIFENRNEIYNYITSNELLIAYVEEKNREKKRQLKNKLKTSIRRKLEFLNKRYDEVIIDEATMFSYLMYTQELPFPEEADNYIQSLKNTAVKIDNITADFIDEIICPNVFLPKIKWQSNASKAFEFVKSLHDREFIFVEQVYNEDTPKSEIIYDERDLLSIYKDRHFSIINPQAYLNNELFPPRLEKIKWCETKKLLVQLVNLLYKNHFIFIERGLDKRNLFIRKHFSDPDGNELKFGTLDVAIKECDSLENNDPRYDESVLNIIKSLKKP